MVKVIFTTSEDDNLITRTMVCNIGKWEIKESGIVEKGKLNAEEIQRALDDNMSHTLSRFIYTIQSKMTND